MDSSSLLEDDTRPSTQDRSEADASGIRINNSNGSRGSPRLRGGGESAIELPGRGTQVTNRC